jgi:PAS domain S-box-containing protein
MKQTSDSSERKSSPAEAGAPVAILLVDDDVNNLVALESILSSPEYHFVRAQSSDAALIALMHGDFAAIVLDVQMPGLSGIELARLIKQRRRTQNIPILFLTAHYLETEHAVLAYDVGAVDYLTKPVHPAVLRSKVAVFVDLFRKTRALAGMNQIMEAEIAERKIAEERFRVVVEAAPSAMLVFTDEGEMKLVNSQAETLFALTREELMQKNISDLLSIRVLPPPGIFSISDSLHRIHAEELMIQRPDGSHVAAELSITPIQSAEGARLLASVVDIGERKRAEEALRTANAELEAKNLALERQAAERLLRLRAEAAQAEAESANAAKDRFLAMLSHELRTPLSPVLHTVTLLEETEGVPAELREHLETIRRNVQLEARLIDDLLDLARIRNGKLNLHLEPTNAHEVLGHALEICRPNIATQKLKVDLQLKARRLWLRADPARLQQIFWNLISNAVKFTPPNGTIHVTTIDDDENESIKVEITDTGVGIEQAKLSRIFNAFEQATHRGSSGLGLGLAICKALTEFHGGVIQATSRGKGYGTTFTVSFPATNTNPGSSMPERVLPSSQESLPLRLLVVEDHADTAATLCNLLGRRGYVVQSASSYNSALEKARDFQFDILVTDIGLPDGNGADLFTALRQQPEREHLQGIALSGFGMDEDVARSQRAGFVEHLTKPIDFYALDRCLIKIGRELVSLAPTPK